MRLIKVPTSSKGQGTLLIVSVALITSFLAGAVAFNQVRLIPDAFELRTNDLDVMTRAETRGKLTANNFVPQAAWYDVNQITYNIGQLHGIGDGVSGNDYDGCYGPHSSCSNGDIPAKELGQKYFDEVEQRLEDQFDGYSDDAMEYEKCDVIIDDEISVQYSVDNPNPIISAVDDDGLVEVQCQDNNLRINYKASSEEYEIDMGNNRFPIFVSMLAAGAFETEGGNKGVEEKADEMEGDGKYDDGGYLGDPSGYWNEDITRGNSCGTFGNPMSSKSNAEDEAEEDVDNVIENQANNIVERIRSAADGAMDSAEPGSKICLPVVGCSPTLPGDINWEDIGNDAEVNSKDWEQDISVSSSKCDCEGWEDPDERDNCNDWTWEATATGKWYLDDVTILLEVWEKRTEAWLDENPTASSNQILVDTNGNGNLEETTLELEEKVTHNFGEPSGYD
jgi:hypothetical protein